MTDGPLIALISATPAAIGPAQDGLADEFPQARIWNILDDQLVKAADDSGGLTDQLSARMRRLIDHALTEGADGVWLTCSIYGAVARGIDGSAIPVLAPDDAAFDEALNGGYRRILIVASFEVAMRDVQHRFQQQVDQRGVELEVLGVAVPEAFEPAKTGDSAALVTALEAGCAPWRERVDAVLLAQYSLAPAASGLAERLGLPVIAGPLSAARVLRSRLAGQEN